MTGGADRLLDVGFVRSRLEALCSLYGASAPYRCDRSDRSEVWAFAEVWSHVHQCVRQTRAVLLLEGEGFARQSVPIVRLVLESAVTVTWLAQDSQRVEGLGAEQARVTRIRFEDAVKRGFGSVTEDDVEAWSGVAQAFAPAEDAAARTIWKRFDRVVFGREFYLVYRGLSELSHAGTALGDEHLRLGDDGSRFVPVVEGREFPTASVLGICGMGLLLSLAVLDSLSDGVSMKKRLVRVGKDLRLDVGKFMHENGVPWRVHE